MSKLIIVAVCLSAIWVGSAVNAEGSLRGLQQLVTLPNMRVPAPAPGTIGPPCTCSIASIFSGVTYCFAVSSATPGTSQQFARTATPTCTAFPSAYTCSGRIVTLAPGITTEAYPNTTITGQGIQCEVNSYKGPIPAPAAPPASAGAPSCISLPASDYGPTGLIAYAQGPPSFTPSPNCAVNSGTVCSINIPFGNGTAKICASQTAEDNIRG